MLCFAIHEYNGKDPSYNRKELFFIQTFYRYLDCNYQLTCDDCIKASARCFWCADGNFDDENMPKGRCSSSKDNCPSDAYISTQSSIEPEGDSDEKTLELRDDEAFTFTVQVGSYVMVK